METNIFQKFLFIILILPLSASCINFGAGIAQTGDDKKEADKTVWGKPQVLATITDETVTESSGIVASRQNTGIFWTHNDSGDDAFIYALDLKGKKRGVWKVTGARNIDWEDIAAYKSAQSGDNYLFIGDIGNNEKAKTELTVYIVKEPKISSNATASTKKKPLSTEKATAIRLKYPDGNKDSETLLVHPKTGDLYVVTKNISGAAAVYRLRAPFADNKVNNLEKVSDVSVPNIPNGFLTGGDIAPDGKRVVLVDYLSAFEFTLPPDAKNFDEIWKEKPHRIELGERNQGEAVCYGTDGNSIYATSEKKNSPLIEVKRK